MADDFAQDVFLKIYKNLASYSPEFKFSTWVMRITTNHIIDYRRKQRFETAPLEAAAHISDSANSPEATLLREEERRHVRKTLESLPEMYKTPLMLYHDQHLPYQEIADRIGEPLSKVKNRIFRGRKLMKDMFLQWEGGNA